MSLQEKLLSSVFAVYNAEADVTWSAHKSCYGIVPEHQWQAQDGSIRLEQTNFVTTAQCVTDVTSATIWNLQQGVSLKVERRLNAEYYTDTSFIEDFLRPVQNYLEIHDHTLCFKALINKVYDEAHKENETYRAAAAPLHERVGEPIKVTDKRVRISLNA